MSDSSPVAAETSAVPRHVVLASRSPSRLSVLRSAGVDPVVMVSDVDEEALLAGELAGAPAAAVVRALADAKARAVAHRLTDSGVSGVAADSVTDSVSGFVIGCDSMLLLDGTLQGKPHTIAETIRRWQAQRGHAAELITGQAVLEIGGGRILRSAATAISTTVHFADVGDADISAYAHTGEPLECAGAFTLEALGGWFIDRIDGDPSAVLGLSLPALRTVLSDWGVDVHLLWNRPNH